MSLISAVGLGFSYRGETLFEDVTFAIKASECVALTGTSGCGKSTLCHILAGVIPRSYTGGLTGYALLDGEKTTDLPLHEIVRRVGIVFQDPDSQIFLPTAEAELAFGPENLCLSTDEISARVSEAFTLFGLEHLRFLPPEQLSGGQRQLVAIASTVALRPKVLILDEAFSALDEDAAVKLYDFAAGFCRAGGSILMVEHDTRRLSLASRVLRMENGRVSEVAHG